MGKRLIIAEKPSVAREIAAALGGFKRAGDWHERHDLIVTSGIGHLVELHADHVADGVFDLERLPVIPPSFRIRCIADRQKQFGLVQQLIARSDVVGLINACDAGREGELIFRLIVALAGSKKPVERLWLRSMTAGSIRQAMGALRPAAEYDGLGAAALCRTEADWLIGINGSRAVTALKPRGAPRKMLSVGRVQTPTLALLVDRELEIQQFKPQPYWEVHAVFRAAAGDYPARWIAPAHAPLDRPGERGSATTDPSDENEPGESAAPDRIPSADQAKAIASRCKGRQADRLEERSERLSRGAPGFFDLTTLQREANRKLKWSAKKTLDVAQALYEQKLLTYPRTDCDALPEDYLGRMGALFEQLMKSSQYRELAARILEHQWIRPSKRLFDDSKITDHFAIIPTGNVPANLKEAEATLFDLVVRRTLAAFYPPAVFERTLRNSWIGQDCFRSRGQVLIDAGWMAAYGGAASEDGALLAKVSAGEKPAAAQVDVKALKTKPPARYTEAALLSAMEHAGRQVEDEALRAAMKARGLGTPATRAAIIENLLGGGRGSKRAPYVTREGRAKHLVPTSLGIDLVLQLRALHVDFLASAELTGEWEQRLREIEAGKMDRRTFMSSIIDTTREMVGKVRAHQGEAHSGITEALPDRATRSFPQGDSVARQPLKSPCPACNQPLSMDERAVSCGCGFKLWRTVAGRLLTEHDVEGLIERGRTEKLDGFTSKAGKPFSAALTLQPQGGVKFVFN